MSMRTRAGKKISLTNYEELLAVPIIEGASDIPLDQLHEFKGHPFHVVDDEAMDELVESIKAKGVLSPAIARKRPEGGFELISGHRRTHAARRAGLDKIPVFVKDYSDDEAVCIMVDSNIQRERILPSEKAFALKMKMDAMKHQGFRSDLISDQNDLKSTLDHKGLKLTTDVIGKDYGMSSSQVKRYIRLTHLLPELLLLVDQEKIKVTNAVEISFLSVDVQKQVLDYSVKDFHENLQGRRIEHAKNEMVRKKGLRLIRILEPGFRSFDDCACISCADDTLESFDQALEVAMECLQQSRSLERQIKGRGITSSFLLRKKMWNQRLLSRSSENLRKNILVKAMKRSIPCLLSL